MKYWLCIALIALTLGAHAQDVTHLRNDASSDKERRFDQSKSYDILHVSLPLVVAGLAFQPVKEDFQQLRNSYCPEASVHFDDYLQYAPAALMLGLKGFGVESRSSWGRMLMSDVLSVAITTLSVNVIKNSTDVKRPDSNARNSFPSGHTTTAFMAATMLHKEYGAVSPWYSIVGYSAATTTAVMRVVNNRHWVSDVLVGAGLGIISTELGYLLVDLILRDRGINRELDRHDQPNWHNIERPSSIGVYLGVVDPLGDISESVKIERGSKVGVEGAYFFNKYVGVGGDLSMANSSVKVDGEFSQEELNVVSAGVGGYFALPLSQRWRLGSKALIGANYYEDFEPDEALHIRKGAYTSISTALSLEYLSNNHFSMKAICGYNASYLSALPKGALLQSVTFGLAGNILF